MRSLLCSIVLSLVAGSLLADEPAAAVPAAGAALHSAGALAFGPEGVLFVADPKGAAVHAFELGRPEASRGKKEAPVPLAISKLLEKTAALLGTAPDRVRLVDIATRPGTGEVYLAVARGRGPEARPVILRAQAPDKLEAVDLAKLKSTRAELRDAPAPGVTKGRGRRKSEARLESITDLAFVKGRVIVAGISNEEFSSTLRAFEYPFQKVTKGTEVEIYHGAHGRLETHAPIRTFVPLQVGSETQLFAAYQCTPLVRIPLDELKPGAHVQGTTIAELGNRNRPLDIISYRQGGKEFLLIANDNRGVMKVPTAGTEKAKGLDKKVASKETAGVDFETVEGWDGILELDLYDPAHAVVVRGDAGGLHLETRALP